MPLISLERAFRCPCKELSSSTRFLMMCKLEVLVAMVWLFIIVLVEVLVIPSVPICVFLSLKLEVSLLLFRNDVFSFKMVTLFFLGLHLFLWYLEGF